MRNCDGIQTQTNCFSCWYLIRAYKTLAHRPPTSSSVLGYDAATVALESLRSAIRKHGGKLPSRMEVATALRGVQLEDALSGALRFNRFGDLLESHAYVLRFDENLHARLVSIVPIEGDVK